MSNYTINLVIGDWSGDGHSMHQTITIESNLHVDEINKAYEKGCDILGIDFVDNICESYQDNLLSLEDWEKFSSCGLKLEDLFKHNSYGSREATESLECGDDIPLDVRAFVQLYLFIIQQGNSEFRFKFPTKTKTDIKIGGYGLFDC